MTDKILDVNMALFRKYRGRVDYEYSLDVNGTDEDEERMIRRKDIYPLYIFLGHTIKSRMTVIFLDGELCYEFIFNII